MGNVAVLRLNLPQPTGRRQLTCVELRPGRIDDQALEVFNYSQCAVLASALHDETGWPLLGIESRCPAGCWHWRHVGVRTPCGRFLDINGVRDYAEAERAWSEFLEGAPVRTVELPTITAFNRWIGMPESSESWWKFEWGHDIVDATKEVLASFVSKLLEGYRAQALAV